MAYMDQDRIANILRGEGNAPIFEDADYDQVSQFQLSLNQMSAILNFYLMGIFVIQTNYSITWG